MVIIKIMKIRFFTRFTSGSLSYFLPDYSIKAIMIYSYSTIKKEAFLPIENALYPN
jgi:hypothetical protein